MERNVSINGKNIFSTWGAELTGSWMEALQTPAPVKEYVTNESRLESGVRVTDAPELRQLAARELTLFVFITGKDMADYQAKYASFVETITSGKLALRVQPLGTEYNLYYQSCNKYGTYGACRGRFALRLWEPNPKDRKKI